MANQQLVDYNLTDNVKDSFVFKMGDLLYRFRYPTTREMRELSQLNNELQELAQEKEADAKLPDEQKSGKDYDKLIEAQGKKSEDKMDTLVTPIEHDVSISTVLEDQPINVVRNFRNMMAKEINLG